jgi:cytochrome c biogenesis protein
MVLFIIIIVTAALSTIVPQGREPSFYLSHYSRALANIILHTHFYNFFRSFIFLIPSALFFINLSVCTGARLARRIQTKAPKRFGPDLIHIGILILIIGAIISLYSRKEWIGYLAEGEWAELPGGYRLVLNHFTRTAYEDGRPKAFISDVDIMLGDEKLSSNKIEVNRPLKLGYVRIYQHTYKSAYTVILNDLQGRTMSLYLGEGFKEGNKTYILKDVLYKNTIYQENVSETEKIRTFAVFEKWTGEASVETLMKGVNDRLDSYRINEIIGQEQTGLRVVRDQGVIPVIISFIIIGAGLILTFTQKFIDLRR